MLFISSVVFTGGEGIARTKTGISTFKVTVLMRLVVEIPSAVSL